MVEWIETFGLNVHMHEVHLELGNLVEDFGLVVGSISMPNGPFCI
jgi:hypothetical protein